jgi:hypothetical protein
VSPIVSDAEILAKVAAGDMTVAVAVALLAESKARATSGTLRCKVSAAVGEDGKPKGGLSVYGVNSKWPVTLYVEQWERLLAFGPQIVAFAKAHPELKRKG